MLRAALPCAFLASFLLQLSTVACAESAAVTSNIVVSAAQEVSRTDAIWACANLDWWPVDKCDYGMCPWGLAGIPNIDFNQPMLQHAVAAFGGAFHLRLGGSLSDFVLYNVSAIDAASCVPFSPATNMTRLGYDFFTGCLSLTRWNEILDFAQLTNISIVFGVSALHGRVQPPACPEGTNCRLPNCPACCIGPWGGDWRNDNLGELLEYTLSKGYSNIYALEFGNELAGQFGIQAKFSPEQYSADFSRFVDTISSAYARHSQAPPLTLVPGNSWDANWFSQFLKLLDSSRTPGIVSHHLYSLGGGFDPASGDRALNPAHLDLVSALAVNVSDALKPLQPPAPAATFSIWMGEGGGAYNSGRNGVTNTFWSGFWCVHPPQPLDCTANGALYCNSRARAGGETFFRYIDQMASFARHGHGSFCRQTLVGGNYGLLNTTTLQPQPDYYSLLLWSRVMGPSVLDVAPDASNPELRAYAHCTQQAAGFPSGAVTIALINLSNNSAVQVQPTIKGTLPSHKATGGMRSDFIFTSAGGPDVLDQLSSHEVLLNGKLLQADDQHGIPPLNPVVSPEDAPLLLPPLSYAFSVYHDAAAAACSSKAAAW